MTRWTPARNELLRRLWDDGTTIKAICYEIGCSPSSLKTQRRKLGLPIRRNRWGEDGGRARIINLYMPDDEFAMVARGATRMRATRTQYIRSLIRRDASAAGGSVIVSRGGEKRVVL